MFSELRKWEGENPGEGLSPEQLLAFSGAVRVGVALGLVSARPEGPPAQALGKHQAFPWPPIGGGDGTVHLCWTFITLPVRISSGARGRVWHCSEGTPNRVPSGPSF